MPTETFPVTKSIRGLFLAHLVLGLRSTIFAPQHVRVSRYFLFHSPTLNIDALVASASSPLEVPRFSRDFQLADSPRVVSAAGPELAAVAAHVRNDMGGNGRLVGVSGGTDPAGMMDGGTEKTCFYFSANLQYHHSLQTPLSKWGSELWWKR